MIRPIASRKTSHSMGNSLAKLRRDAGVTQLELALRMNTCQSDISRMEINQGDIKVSTVKRYVEALGKTLNIVVVDAKGESITLPY